ncbi:UDP-N-acetylmuramoyl-L-alanyl-D-glutamate--2,6-diaminopimelate ligase [subsurface metagenome]
MVKSIFDTAGMDCGLIGTINHLIAGEKIESLNTTPEAPDIQLYLAQMARAGQNACVLEVSSHALALSRVYGIQFRAAAYLNLSRDHLDFHGNLERYLEAKSILFSDLAGDSTAVVNLDDRFAEHIISISRGANIITFGSDEKADIHPKNIVLESGKSEITLVTPQGEAALTLSLPGLFNVSNAMAATGIGIACGIPLPVIVKGLENLKSVKGRYEIVDEGQDFTVVVDYAHSPDALDRILTSARETTKARLISVFGCGGVRDKGKRPLMGEISTRIADFSVITSDNPRTEDPDDILRDIVEGVGSSDNYIVIQDRASAIKKVIEMANSGDIVVIAGKGHEDYQIIGGEKKHFDDVETARSVIRALK